MDVKFQMENFCKMVCSLSPESQDSFFKSLEGKITPDDIRSLQVAVSLYSMYKDPRKYEALKQAVGEKLYEEFTK